MNRKILGNSFFMVLHLTGISRLRRAPERQVTQAEDYAQSRSCIHFLPTAAHTSQDPGLLLILCHLIIMQLACTLESKFLNPKPSAKNFAFKHVARPHLACVGQLALIPAGSEKGLMNSRYKTTEHRFLWNGNRSMQS